MLLGVGNRHWSASLLLLAVVVLASAASTAGEPLRVAAAISLKEVLTATVESFAAQTGVEVELVFGSSGQLLAQVRSGAPVDVFISAAAEQADALERDGLALAGSRRTIAGNRLVLIAPVEQSAQLDSFTALTEPSLRRLAIGEPATVPAGRYAAQVLDKLGLTERLEGRLIYGSNVRQVLAYVERGEVTAGIVYASDTRAASAAVRVVAMADPDWHDPIDYPALIVQTTRQAERATQFLHHLTGDEARQALSERGFTLPPRPDESTLSDARLPDAPHPQSADKRRDGTSGVGAAR